MPSLFTKPAAKIRDLPLAGKLALMALLLFAPTVIVGALLYSAENFRIQTTRTEIAGLQHLRPLISLAANLAAYRQATVEALTKGHNMEALLTAQKQVEAALTTAKRSGQEFGDRFRTQALLAEIDEAWTSNVKPNWNAGNPTLAHDVQTLLIAQVTDAIRLTGATSRIDIDIDGGGHLGSQILLQLPPAAESLAQLVSFSVAMSRQETVTPEQWDRMAVFSQDVRRITETLRATLLFASKKAPLDPSVKTIADRAAGSAETFLDSVQEASSRRQGFNPDPDTYKAQADEAVVSMAALQALSLEATESSMQARLDALEWARLLQIFAVIGLGALVLGLGYLIASGVNRQVRSMTDVFRRISENDLSARADVYANDELGMFAESLNRILDETIALVQSREHRDRLQANILKLLREIEGVAEGDLTKHAEVSAEVTGTIAHNFNLMLAELRTLIHRVQEYTHAVNSAAVGVQETTEVLADGSELQATQIVQAYAAVEQMGTSIEQVTSQAANAARIAQSALNHAQLGAESARLTITGMSDVRGQVHQTAHLVAELRESSGKIGEFAQVIADISRRTSVIALTASIQAGAAGEAGRRFVVISDQIEELAARSSEAVRGVATLAKSIQTSMQNVIEAMDKATGQVTAGEGLAAQAGLRLGQIESDAVQLSEVMKSILAACQHQSSSSGAITQSMGQISRVTRDTNAGVQAVACSIRDLTALVEQLRNSVSRFKLPKAG